MANMVFKDNSAVILRKIGTNSQTAMQNAADMLVEAVQEKMLYGYHTPHGRPPHTEIVDTGALFESIQAKVKRVAQNAFNVDVGTDLEYGRWVHEGYTQKAGLVFQGSDGNWYTTKGGRIEGRPFIRDGVMGKQKELKELLSTDLSAGFGKK